MELVEGHTLADRLGSRVPIDEALAIARQICHALEAAHDRGIVHRDLKPANVKIRPDGTVKVLDFGLAKPADAGPASAMNVTASPTMTSPAMTGVGVILGTAAYMAPEQARGRAVDKRADIWALGVILYEMLSGRRAFAGDDVSEVMASVIKSDPDWTALPKDAPPAVQSTLVRCLKKDPAGEFATRAMCGWLSRGPSHPSHPQPTRRRPEHAGCGRPQPQWRCWRPPPSLSSTSASGRRRRS
jgi:serine/threonine-protein kinase